MQVAPCQIAPADIPAPTLVQRYQAALGNLTADDVGLCVETPIWGDRCYSWCLRTGVLGDVRHAHAADQFGAAWDDLPNNEAKRAYARFFAALPSDDDVLAAIFGPAQQFGRPAAGMTLPDCSATNAARRVVDATLARRLAA